MPSAVIDERDESKDVLRRGAKSIGLQILLARKLYTELVNLRAWPVYGESTVT